MNFFKLLNHPKYMCVIQLMPKRVFYVLFLSMTRHFSLQVYCFSFERLRDLHTKLSDKHIIFKMCTKYNFQIFLVQTFSLHTGPYFLEFLNKCGYQEAENCQKMLKLLNMAKKLAKRAKNWLKRPKIGLRWQKMAKNWLKMEKSGCYIFHEIPSRKSGSQPA